MMLQEVTIVLINIYYTGGGLDHKPINLYHTILKHTRGGNAQSIPLFIDSFKRKCLYYNTNSYSYFNTNTVKIWTKSRRDVCFS